MKQGISDNDLSVSTENIMVQRDVTIVATIQNYFEQIIEKVKDIKPKEGRALADRTIRILFAKIDEATSTRFGINLKTMETKEVLLAVQTTTSANYNILAGNVADNYTRIRDMVGAPKEGDGVKSTDTDVGNWVNVLKTYQKSIDAVDKELELSGITIDLKNAKIYGYPKKALAVIVINPVALIDDVNMDAKMLTAAYLHECGHIFTHLEYASRTTNDTTILIESLLSELGKNKTPLEAIKLSYSKTSGGDTISEATNIPTAVVGITSKYINDLRSMGGNAYLNKNSERIADQFVTRFGLGDELVSALNEIHKYTESKGLKSVILDTGSVLLKMLHVSVVLAILIPPLGLILGVVTLAAMWYLALYLLSGFVLYTLFMSIVAIMDGGIDTEFPYDSPKRRVLRIKNELVRQLRANKTDKKVTAAILSSINTLVDVANRLDDKNEEFIYRFIGLFSSYSSDQNEMRKLDDGIEDLLNNDLHIASNKLKTIVE